MNAAHKRGREVGFLYVANAQETAHLHRQPVEQDEFSHKNPEMSANSNVSRQFESQVVLHNVL